MYKNLLSLLTCTMLLPACSSSTPNISVVCEENNIGNSIVKWETAPILKGNVKVYTSTDPKKITEEIPASITNISNQWMTIVTKDPTKRYYYSLVFNDEYRVRVATRNVNIPGIQNFRDVGGYLSHKTKKQVRWGMLYRSAQIDSLECYSYRELKNIGIKTIIDLRSPSERKYRPSLQEGFNVVHIPIDMGDMEEIMKDILEQGIKRDSTYQIAKQMNRNLVRNYHKEYRQIFDVLLESANYPVVVHGSSGKGRTGIATALILASLGVSSDVIMEDYCFSNKHFNIPGRSDYTYHLPTRSQETITSVYSAGEDFLNAAKDEIECRYGDVDTYLKRAIGLSKDEIKQLQSILLY